jgi:hypothetical protein
MKRGRFEWFLTTRGVPSKAPFTRPTSLLLCSVAGKMLKSEFWKPDKNLWAILSQAFF